MSTVALIALLGGIGGLALAMWLIVHADRCVPTTGDDIRDPIAKAYWQEQVDKASLDFGLAGTRASAGKWGASAAAILGVLSTAAVVAGPSDLAKDVGRTEAWIAATLVLVAGSLAALATLLAGLAEQGSPVTRTDLNPGLLRRLTRERAARAAEQIRWSRILTALSLCFILAGAAVAWLTALTGDSKKESAQSAIVVGSSGSACGTLTTKGASLKLKVGKATSAIGADARITLVTACPK